VQKVKAENGCFGQKVQPEKGGFRQKVEPEIRDYDGSWEYGVKFNSSKRKKCRSRN